MYETESFDDFDKWCSEQKVEPLKGGRKSGIVGFTPYQEKNIPCRHREHSPPGMYHYKPGHYTYVCPACGQKQEFDVAPSARMAVAG